MNSGSKNQLEQALHDAHRTQTLLDATIGSTASGVVVCDLDVNFVLVNPAAKKLLGDIAELAPEHWNDSLGLFESENGRLFEPHELPLFRATNGESVDRMELLVRNGVDAEPIWVEANATQILGLNNELLGAVTVFNDVTLEKRERERLHDLQEQTQSKLVDTNMQLADVLSTISEAIWRGIKTEDGFRFTYFSQGIEQITGFTPEQLTDGGGWFERLVHEEDRDWIKRLAIELSPDDTEGAEVECRMVHADGSIRWVLNRIRAVKGDSLTVQGMLIDITNQRETRQVLDRAGRLASIGTLAAGVAHEINNPLAAIMLTSELAKARMDMGGISSEQLEEVFADIKQQVEHCSKIVKGVMMFANNETTARETCSVHNIAIEAMKLIKFQAKKRKIEIRLLEVNGREPMANVNDTEIGQVIGSLLANAIEASPDEAEIEIGIQTVGDRVICSVSDSGSGLKPEHEQAVFDPFFTSRRTTGGIGLGLSMSHRIISNHGGEIWIEKTELGKGTTFCFALPVAN